MDTSYTAYLEQMEHLRDEVRQILLGLDEHSLNWRPSTDAPSIFVLAQHSIWFEQGTIGHEVGGQPIAYDWPDDTALPEADDDASDLLFMLDEAATLTQSVFDATDAGMLDEPLADSQSPATPTTARALIVAVLDGYTMAIETMRQTRQQWEKTHDTANGA